MKEFEKIRSYVVSDSSGLRLGELVACQWAGGYK